MSQGIGKVALLLAVAVLAWPFLAAAPARAQATRTWVSGTGNDDNPCSRTAPCKTFLGALSNNKTAPGGEVNCLDPGDFGTVVITFSVTISCEGGTAGIQIPADNFLGIGISAAATDVVTLRGLHIDGKGIGREQGIRIQSAKEVHIEKCSISNFRGSLEGTGIYVYPGVSFTGSVFIEDTVINDNAGGIFINNSGGFKVVSLKNVTITGSTSVGLVAADANVFVNVSQSIISGSGDRAVSAGANATINIDRTTIANNGTGLFAIGGGALIRMSGNNIYNNTTGISILSGGTVQSDGTNKHGNSNGGAQVPNGSLAEY